MRNELMIKALIGLIEMAKEVLDGEECDHEEGICFCDWTKRLLDAEKALETVRQADLAVSVAEQVAESGVEFVNEGSFFLVPQKDEISSGYNWELYCEDWSFVGYAPGHITAEAAAHSAKMWVDGRKFGFDQGKQSGVDSMRRGLLKLLDFDGAVLRTLDEYGVARPII